MDKGVGIYCGRGVGWAGRRVVKGKVIEIAIIA